MRKKSKLIYGVGINDADYATSPTVNGKRLWCPFYNTWIGMLKRCYCAKYQARKPTYIDCTVDPEWHRFSTFKEWMVQQPREGKELDKDLLIVGNKVYSPDTCVFVSHKLNSFTTERGNDRGEHPLGVYFDASNRRLRARCRNPFSGKQEHLGLFTCPHEAHEAWRARKHELAQLLADEQTDPRIAAALRIRYAPGVHQVAA